ncbi:MAG: penicillin-binding transpeptidase domain-containing protein [Microthrixaceae bacterium]
MNTQIRRVALGMLVLYGALFIRLNVVQVFSAPDLNAREGNNRQVLRDFDRPRGKIQTADGTVVAFTEEVDNRRFDYQRRYPTGDLFAHITGYFTLNLGSTGVERSYGDELSGQSSELEFKALTNLFDAEAPTGDVVLSLRRDLQETARDALGDRQGSVVALDPRTGDVLALWSYPSYDPNQLVEGTSDETLFRKTALDNDPQKPLLARSYRELYPPGSTFKVVTGSAGIRSEKVTVDSPSYPRLRNWAPPGTTRPLSNFDGSLCGGTLDEIMRVSCNTAFAQMGSGTVGPEGLVDTAQDYGFGDTPPLDLPGGVKSAIPTDYGRRLGPFPDGEDGTVYEDTPGLAQVAIGQGNARATPLQMALVAAGVGNEGVIMAPHVVAEVRDAAGDVVREVKPERWKTPLDQDQAAVMRQVMDSVVADGTAKAMAIPNVEVGGKTGTAQTVGGVDRSHAWVIGFAGTPGEPAEVAVAVIVEAQEGVSEQTGGRVAAPIARRMLQTALFPQPAGDAGNGPTGGGG